MIAQPVGAPITLRTAFGCPQILGAASSCRYNVTIFAASAHCFDLAGTCPAIYGRSMQAKQQSLTGRRIRVFVVTPFILAIYSLLAVLCVGGQLPAFGTSPVHNNAPEVIHLQTNGSLGAQQMSVPDTAGAPSAELRAKSETELGILPDQSRSELGKIGLTSSWMGPHPISRSSSRVEDQLSASHALWRWHRTVVLII